MLPIHMLVARAIKTQVEGFSEPALCSDDVSLQARERSFRLGVTLTAQAIAVNFHAANATFDIAGFAIACGLYMSDGRDNYRDWIPIQLTWEHPRDTVVASTVPNPGAPASGPEQYVPDSELGALPEYNGWRAAYEYPGYIQYAHPEHTILVCASSDFNGEGKLDIQIMTTDGDIFDDGENEPWPLTGRTVEKLFARLHPYLDKYHPTAASALKETP